MKKIYSNCIFDGEANFLFDAGLILNQQHEIVELLPAGSFRKEEFLFYPGLLTPGFINAHCHLELSHLKGRIPSGTGLLSFLKQVVSLREISQSEIDEAIIRADQEMYQNGIVAVGDISNQSDTYAVKKSSKIYYHTFVEAFDFMQDHLAEQMFDQYSSVYHSFGELPRSLVPHASYSVSDRLFEKIRTFNSEQAIISIHNQEVKDENELFESKGGGFIPFFEGFGFDYSHFQPKTYNAIDHNLIHLDKKIQTLFIHNTQTRYNDVKKVIENFDRAYFVTCPNANLYIENQLPDYEQFAAAGHRICIGTDSLSSNWQLDILSEIKTILKYKSKLSLTSVLSWACKQGANALGIDHKYGSFSPGKSPGVNWIKEIVIMGQDLTILPEARVKKLH